jgi:tRNA dimethylallyltransferase
MTERKVIFISGATGVGKSLLAIELAKQLNGVVLNSDAMQVYDALPVATNRVTEEEKNGVPHYLFGIFEASSSVTINEYLRAALEVIDTISIERPIVFVGGTNYYMENLLFEDMLVASDPKQIDKDKSSLPVSCNDSGSSPEELFRQLEELDPVRAAMLHPKDVRKVMRSLEICATGRKHSDIIEEQEKRSWRERCRFAEPLVFWLDAEQSALNDRIAKRVDLMETNGILEEVLHFYKTVYLPEEAAVSCSNSNVSQTLCERGIFQAIGFKEFLPFCRDPENMATRKECLQRLSQVTQKYAKKQKHWMSHRLSKKVPVHTLDATDLTCWHQRVLQPAVALTQQWMSSNTNMWQQMHPWPEDDRSRSVAQACPLCHIRVMDARAWEQHCRSKGHRHRQKLAAKKKEKEEEEEEEEEEEKKAKEEA